jgi:catechol 2,3-dioxygenase-like lactoylglutathione lyase family enzyme
MPAIRLTHLGLPVRDLDRARAFYETWLGFAARPPQQYPDGTVFVRNAEGFDLALHPLPDGEQPYPMPPFFHFGFRLPTAEDVHA